MLTNHDCIIVSTSNGGPAAPPPPPPPPPPEADEIPSGGGADSGRNALLASLNQGENVTKGEKILNTNRYFGCDITFQLCSKEALF